METRPYRLPGQRTRTEYQLTAKRWDLYPVLVAIVQWGDKYLADPEGPPILLLHADSGRPVRAVIECSAERTPVTVRDAQVIPGPSARLIEGSRNTHALREGGTARGAHGPARRRPTWRRWPRPSAGATR